MIRAVAKWLRDWGSIVLVVAALAAWEWVTGLPAKVVIVSVVGSSFLATLWYRTDETSLRSEELARELVNLENRICALETAVLASDGCTPERSAMIRPT